MGHHNGLPQQAHRLAIGKLHQPALPGGIGERDPQIAEAFDGRSSKIQIQRSGLEPAATQQAHHSEQALHQRQMLLERFEGSGQRAGLGLAFRQRHQGGRIQAGSGFDQTQAEAEVLQHPFAAQLQGHGNGLIPFADPQCRSLVEGGGQQGEPLGAGTVGPGLLVQPGVQGASRADAFGHCWGMDPEAPAPFFPGFEGEAW